MNIGDVLQQLGSLPYLAIPGEVTLEEAAEQVTDLRQVRGIYVVDEAGRLMGAISLGVLLRHITAARHRPRFYERSLLARITSEKVADLMDRHVISAGQEDEVAAVVDRMVTANIKEIPVVDEKQRLIGSVGLLDLWKILQKKA